MNRTSRKDMIFILNNMKINRKKRIFFYLKFPYQENQI